MGNILAHAEISHHVIGQLQPMTPGANLIYLELGNFITDISQFRDPYAFMSAKQRLPLVARIGRSATPEITLWADQLLGKAPDKRFAALAQFFMHFARFATQFLFAKDSPLVVDFLERIRARSVGQAANQVDQALASLLTAKEVNRVFDQAFTQYYPHEHLDFPPFSEGPKHRQHLFYRSSSRNVIRYLEEQLLFISEELSKIELEWVRNRSVPLKDPKICDLLVRLGHILHAVEDYFFHSNFIELWQWHRVQRLHSQRKPDVNREDRNFLVDNGLETTLYDDHSILLRRRFARRLRYPIFTRGTKGDPEESEDATHFVYTGGFGGTEVFHTVTGALESMEEFLERIEPLEREQVRRLRESDLVLIRLLFNQGERHVLATSRGFRDRQLKEHRRQVLSGEYRKRISQEREKPLFNDEAKEALLRAFEVDETFMRSHPKQFGADLPGVGEFLILFLAEAQSEGEKSESVVKTLNTQRESIHNLGTENGASEETIGTHSLIAKDGTKKQPLRNEAMALAKFVSATLAVLMISRIQKGPNPQQGYDWEAIVKHFVRFPANGLNNHQGSSGWETEVLNALVATQGNLPTLDGVQDKPKLSLLTSDDAGKKLQKLRDGTTTQQLEKLYKDMESRAG
jgi:hypothetical protein